jgi:hypothetical protein
MTFDYSQNIMLLFHQIRGNIFISDNTKLPIKKIKNKKTEPKEHVIQSGVVGLGPKQQTKQRSCLVRFDGL